MEQLLGAYISPSVVLCWPPRLRRHVVLMSHAKGFPMYQLRSGEMAHPGMVYRCCVEMIIRLARHGLIHCDFNEFNLMVDEEERLTLIDFPQMVSTRHANAQEMFKRCRIFSLQVYLDAFCWTSTSLHLRGSLATGTSAVIVHAHLPVLHEVFLYLALGVHAEPSNYR